MINGFLSIPYTQTLNNFKVIQNLFIRPWYISLKIVYQGSYVM